MKKLTKSECLGKGILWGSLCFFLTLFMEKFVFETYIHGLTVFIFAVIWLIGGYVYGILLWNNLNKCKEVKKWKK